MKKVCVNKNACIGCGSCQAIAPTVFEINGEGVSEVKKEDFEKLTKEEKEQANDAQGGCPTGAIEIKEEK
jgi:ferredoxin